MKKIIMLFLLTPFIILAQTETDTSNGRIVVTEDVNECINKIQENPQVIKLFLRNLAQDPERMRKIYKDLINDPEVKDIINEIRKNMRKYEGKNEDDTGSIGLNNKG